MGTNYYLMKGICPTCKRPEHEIHIGKSSCGWSFSFHGIGDLYEVEDYGLKGVVLCENDWKREMKDGEIRDEYGEKITKKEFWEMVEAKRKGLNHTIECKKQYGGDHGWLDENGSSFSEGDFS